MPEKQIKKSSIVGGLNQNIASVIAYLGAWVTGLIFLLIEKDNNFIRFHAAQSLVTFGGLTILGMVPFIGWIISPLLALVAFILWVLLIIKAYQGEKYKLPYIGDLAEKLLTKI